jgi:hypothetical protein
MDASLGRTVSTLNLPALLSPRVHPHAGSRGSRNVTRTFDDTGGPEAYRTEVLVEDSLEALTAPRSRIRAPRPSDVRQHSSGYGPET